MIEAEGVSKVFRSRAGDFAALSDFNLSVARDEPTALVGPNGAGKTTILRILSTTIIPTTGEAMVEGHSVLREPEKAREAVGLVTSSERSLYFRLTGLENLICFGTLYDFSVAEAKERAVELLRVVGLGEWGDTLYMKYSQGMQRRLAVARALLHDPPVLLLDEPTLGIDPISSRGLVDLIRSFAKERTILFTSHNMEEVERLAAKVCILREGKVLSMGSPAELKSKYGVPGDRSMDEVYMKAVGEQQIDIQSRWFRRGRRWHE